MEDLEQGKLLERLIASSVDGVLAFDHECRYTVWNPGMERISGVPAAEALGRVAFDVFPFLVEIGEDGPDSSDSDRPQAGAVVEVGDGAAGPVGG